MDFAGLHLKNPIIIASGPTTAKIEQLEETEKYGAAAVSIKHVMTRQKYHGKLRCYSDPENVMVFPSDKRLTLNEGLKLIEHAKKRTSLVILVNFSSQEPDLESYGRLASQIESAGADGFSLVGGKSLAAPPVDIYNNGKPLYPLMGHSSFGAITDSAIRYDTFKITAQVAQRVKVPLTS